MIYGDPFYFALQFDIVENWTDPNSLWKNGVFYFYLDGRKIFDIVDVYELKTTESFYSKMDIESLPINDIDITPSNLYENASSYFMGDGQELISGLFDMTCTAMQDAGCYVYFIKTSQCDRFVWSYDDGKTVEEILLPLKTVDGVIKKIRTSED